MTEVGKQWVPVAVEDTDCELDYIVREICRRIAGVNRRKVETISNWTKRMQQRSTETQPEERAETWEFV